MATKLPSPKSEGCEMLALHLKAAKIPFIREFKFHPTRKWRLDFALTDGLGVEVEGGVYVQGRHNRGAGMEADLIKYNAALLCGYRVLRFSTWQVKAGMAIKVIEEALA